MPTTVLLTSPPPPGFSDLATALKYFSKLLLNQEARFFQSKARTAVHCSEVLSHKYFFRAKIQITSQQNSIV